MHAADLMGIDYPYVLRMVELDGEQTEVTLSFSATVAAAVQTNLLGEPKDALQRPGSKLHVAMGPHEIATIYADMVMGRKEWRDLDAKRKVWATIHKQH